MLSSATTATLANSDDANWLIQLMNRSGLPYVNQAGVCWGMSMMAVLDVLRAAADEYDQRFKNLFDHASNGSSVNPKEHQFLKTVALFNDPTGTDLPDTPVQHTQMTGLVPILEYLTSDESHTYTPLPFKVHVSKQTMNAYDEANLEAYLSRIEAAILAENTTSHFPFLISSIEHAIAVSFNASTQQWQIRNTMKRETSTFESAKDASTQVWKIFTEVYRSSHVMFTTRFFATDATKEALSVIVNNAHSVIDTNTISALSQKDKNRLLAFACAEGDIALIEALLMQDVDVNYYDNHILPPLVGAAINARDAVIRRLHETGKLTINLTNPADGQTALWKAVTQHRESSVNALLSIGADATISDTRQRTPLIQATIRGLNEMVERLLPYSANVINQKDIKYGRTALHYAAIYGSVEIVRTLLAADADAAVRDNQGNTALMLAETSPYHKREKDAPNLRATISLLKEDLDERKNAVVAETSVPSTEISIPLTASTATLFNAPVTTPTTPRTAPDTTTPVLTTSTSKHCLACSLI